MKMSETGMFKITTRDKGENSTPKKQEQKMNEKFLLDFNDI